MPRASCGGDCLLGRRRRSFRSVETVTGGRLWRLNSRRHREIMVWGGQAWGEHCVYPRRPNILSSEGGWGCPQRHGAKFWCLSLGELEKSICLTSTGWGSSGARGWEVVGKQIVYPTPAGARGVGATDTTNTEAARSRASLNAGSESLAGTLWKDVGWGTSSEFSL